MAHAGSWNWYGMQLPDFGVTEKIQSIIKPSASYSSQGGSNLWGNQSANSNVGQIGPAVYPTNLTTSSSGGSSSTGTATNGSQQYTSPAGPSAPSSSSGPSYGDQQRQSIENQWGSYFSDLDRQAGVLPETQKSLEGQVQNMYTDQAGQVTSSRDSSLADLGKARSDTNTRQVAGLRDLASNMRNMLQAGQIYLGARGAGDSSASNMYSYALSKVSNQNRANLLNKAQETYANIDLQTNKVKQVAQDQMNRLTSWKNNELLKISDYIRGEQAKIASARAQGYQLKEEAVRNLNQQIYSQAQQMLANIDAQASAYKQGLVQWATTRAQSLEELKKNLAGMSQVQLPDLTPSTLPTLSMGGNGNTYDYMTNYAGSGKKWNPVTQRYE